MARARKLVGLPSEPHKKGRRLYGFVVTTKTGERVYVAHRKLGEIYVDGERSISDAIRIGSAGWAIDSSTLHTMRGKGVRALAVSVRDTGDLYVARLDDFFDPALYKSINYTGVGRGGSAQRVLPLTRFERQRAAPKI